MERRRIFSPATELRLKRLRVAVNGAGLTLAETARVAHVSLTTASIAERFPERVDPDVLRRLDEAVDKIAAGGSR